MPRKIPPEVLERLNDKNWLIEQHINQLFSIVEISKRLKVTPATVTRALRKFGIQSPSQQALREASNKRKYGVANPGSVPEFRRKALNTMIQKMGGHNWSQPNRNKRDTTCLKLYGDSNVGKTTYARQKVLQTNLVRYGRKHIKQSHLSTDVINLLENQEWLYNQHVVQQKSLSQIALELGFAGDMTTVMRRMRKHGISTQHFQHSFGEKQIIEFLRQHGITNIQQNTRAVIPPQELDIYLPDYNLAIEYCGLYWHSERFKQRLYHRNKMRECNKIGIRLLTIFENEWIYNQEIVKSKILSVLKKNYRTTVFARKCKIIELTKKQKKQFFDNYHIQQDGPGSISYGLVYQDTIVAAITFIKLKNNEYILNRYATNCNVPGGFTRLLSHFQKMNKWTKIITFADMRWSEGKLYENSGFILDKILEPDYQYIINGNLIHKFNFRRKYLPIKLKKFDPLLSEWENCKMNNIDRIWDCGKKRYVLENKLG